MNSKRKGARAERAFASLLRAAGFMARRGVQFQGGHTPDVIVPDLEKYHFEVKNTERIRIRDWLAQVEADRGGKPFVIAWRRNYGPWLAIVEMDTLLDLLRETISASVPIEPKREEAAAATAPESKPCDSTNCIPQNG